ncbi:homeobox KN domain-containing protein [Phthorimaea operculella]|nr:homeobox KN domain-containing protein [Phthorimaea operculella]
MQTLLTDTCASLGPCRPYSDMFQECFNLDMATDTELTDLICGSCICRLEDALEFKLEVLESQEKLLKKIKPEDATIELKELSSTEISLTKSIFIDDNDESGESKLIIPRESSSPQPTDDNSGGTKKMPRLPPQAIEVLKTWLTENIKCPYPNEHVKQTIASQLNLTVVQVNNWFINARHRYMRKMGIDLKSAFNFF